MAHNKIQVRTTACYRGLPVTVIGSPHTALVAVAAYRTPFELALAVISSAAMGRDGVATDYRVAGHGT
jgi:hypothetical protein